MAINIKFGGANIYKPGGTTLWKPSVEYKFLITLKTLIGRKWVYIDAHGDFLT